MTCFWQHDLKAIWGVSNSIHQHLPQMLVGIVDIVHSHGSKMALMSGYGKGTVISHIDVEAARQLMSLEYAIIGDDDNPPDPTLDGDGVVDLRASKEFKRLERSV